MESCTLIYNRRDIEEKTQSIAFYSSKKNKLEYLGTNHDNLPLEFNKNQVRGTASKIMEFLIEKSTLIGKDLILNAIPSARSFYEKHGFVNNGHGNNMDGEPMIYKIPELLATAS